MNVSEAIRFIRDYNRWRGMDASHLLPELRDELTARGFESKKIDATVEQWKHRSKRLFFYLPTEASEDKSWLVKDCIQKLAGHDDSESVEREAL